MWNLAKDKYWGISHQRVRELFKYNPFTGHLLWRMKVGRGRNVTKIGSVAGKPLKRGYIHVAFDGHEVLAHRLIWFYMTSKWPVCQIDHINRQKDDNSWCNLREADHVQNKANVIDASQNKSTGIRGINWSKTRKKYTVRIEVNRKVHFLGRFANLDDAKAVRRKAELKYHGEFAPR